jgi:hypothetical protein
MGAESKQNQWIIGRHKTGSTAEGKRKEGRR